MIYDLELFKKYEIKLNWDIIIYGLENHFLSYDFVESYLCDKLENQSGLLESEMNLLIDLIDQRKFNFPEDWNINLWKRLSPYLIQTKEQKIISKHIFLYLDLNYVLKKYKSANNFNNLDYNGLYSELSQIWFEFDYEPDLRSFCDTYWVETFKNLEEKEKYCQWISSLVNDYLLKLSKKYNWKLNLGSNNE